MKTKKLITWITAFAMAVAMMPPISHAQESADPDTQSNDIIVVYESDAAVTKALEGEDIEPAREAVSEPVQEITDECTASVAEQTGSEVTEGTIIAGSLGNDGAVMQVTLEEDADVAEAIDTLNEDPDIAYAQENYTYELMDDVPRLQSASLNDEYVLGQYYLGAWKAPYYGANVLNAWEETRTNGTVSVAVIDSGVQKNHPDLAANLDLANSYSVSGDINDTVGHGTCVAGIIAAAANNGVGVAGTSYNAKIVPINVIGDNGMAKSTSLIAAFSHIKKQIDNNKLKNLHVINISLGSYSEAWKDSAVRSAIRELRDSYEVLTVCAGGNGKGPSMTSPIYPGDFDECFCVTALDPHGYNMPWYDYNEYKDISAPGDEILSTWIGSDYAVVQGTSFSAPIVSGIMALLWVENPNITVDEAVAAAEATANPVNTGKNDRTTGSKGAIDAAKALQYVRDNYGSAKPSISNFRAKTTLSAKSYTYNGKAKKPSVKISGATINEDFKVSYKNNVKVGTATATITGMGVYRGVIKKTFTINPKGTKIKSLKKYKKAFKVTWKKQKTQVTGYQIRYSLNSSMKNAKIKTVKGATKTSKKIKKLKKKKKYYVQVRTYRTVSGKKYYSSWSAKKTIKTK